jgi:hypothetical protein
MKYSELMIGDYVKYQGHIYIIEEISAKGWVHLINPETKTRVNVTSDYIIDLLEPIPLTSEILERNGFKKYEEDYHNEYVCEKCDETSYYEVVICWKDSYDNGALDAFNHVQWDEGWKLDIVSEGSYNKGWCKTIYLHELQHALRLCGLNDLADDLKLEE